MVDEQEAVGSPWDGEEPSFKPLPETNPKTGGPIQFYGCTLCGALTVSRKLHSRWHRSQPPGTPF